MEREKIRHGRGWGLVMVLVMVIVYYFTREGVNCSIPTLDGARRLGPGLEMFLGGRIGVEKGRMPVRRVLSLSWVDRSLS